MAYPQHFSPPEKPRIIQMLVRVGLAQTDKQAERIVLGGVVLAALATLFLLWPQDESAADDPSGEMDPVEAIKAERL